MKKKYKYIHNYLPLIVLILVILLIHLTLSPDFGDDVIQRANTGSIWALLIHIYHNWSSRVILYVFSFVFCWSTPLAWKVINTLVILGIAFSYSSLCTSEKIDKKTTNWIIVAFLFLYPWADMSTAGWIVTTTHYLWPLCFLLLSIIPIKKIEKKESFRVWEYPLYFIFAIIGGNQEQGAACLFGIYFSYLCYTIFKRRLNKVVIIQFSISLLNILFIFFNPGNKARSLDEIRWFADFNMLALSEKIDVGLSRTLYQMFFTPNIIVLVCCILSTSLVFHKTKALLFRIISLIPTLTIICFGFLVSLSSQVFPNFTQITSQLIPYEGLNSVSLNHGTINFSNFTSIYSYLAFFMLCFAFICLVTSVYIVFSDSIRGVIMVFILALGVAVTAIMGFSPTLWASGTRTFLFMYMSLIGCGVCLLQEYFLNYCNKRQKIVIIMTILSAVTLANSFLPFMKFS